MDMTNRSRDEFIRLAKESLALNKRASAKFYAIGALVRMGYEKNEVMKQQSATDLIAWIDRIA